MLVDLLQMKARLTATPLQRYAIPLTQALGLLLLITNVFAHGVLMSLEALANDPSKSSQHAKAVIISLTFKSLNVHCRALHPRVDLFRDFKDHFSAGFKKSENVGVPGAACAEFFDDVVVRPVPITIKQLEQKL